MPDFESVVGELQHYRAVGDAMRWKAGDVVNSYLKSERSDAESADTVRDKLAAHSGYTRAQLREYSHCSAFFSEIVRDDYPEVVTWSHFNRARRCGDFDRAIQLLNLCAEESWSVAQLDRYRAEMYSDDSDPDEEESGTDSAEVVDVSEEIVEALKHLDRATSAAKGSLRKVIIKVSAALRKLKVGERVE